VGEALPGGRDAWYEQRKWTEWILSPRGHGPEWEVVLRVGSEDADVLWDALAAAVVEAPLYGVRLAEGGGMLCEVRFRLSVRDRTAMAVTVWHLAHEGVAPRLVTAYPRPYTG
jgi:hypothetical protein